MVIKRLFKINTWNNYIAINSRRAFLLLRLWAVWVGWNESSRVSIICTHNLQTKAWNLRRRSGSGGSGHQQEDEWLPNYNANKTRWTKPTRGQKRPIIWHLVTEFRSIWSIMQIFSKAQAHLMLFLADDYQIIKNKKRIRRNFSKIVQSEPKCSCCTNKDKAQCKGTGWQHKICLFSVGRRAAKGLLAAPSCTFAHVISAIEGRRPLAVWPNS